VTEPEDRTPAAVKRRHVFYLSGFDPRGPLHYHRLYRDESRKQAAVNGLTVTTDKRRTIDEVESCWTVTANGVTTTYSFLRYEDIIRQHWPASALPMFVAILKYSWCFARKGVFAMILRNAWPTFIAVIYPLLVVALSVLAAALLWIAVAVLLNPFTGALAWLLAAPLLGLPLLLYGPLEQTFNAFWLARSCAFLVSRSRSEVAGIEERCDVFARRVADAVRREGNDEVLVIGHSVGTHLAVTVAARAIEQMDEGSCIRLLTLGQSVAMTPDGPAARQYRADLLAVATSPKVKWIDVTSAIDGSCIPLTDPLATSGVARPPGAALQPKLVSARFNAMFSPEAYALIRRDYLRVHFQYLMASEMPGDYDYMLITAGGRTLEDRFAHLDSVTDFNRFRIGKT
jgi:hypothetical protein